MRTALPFPFSLKEFFYILSSRFLTPSVSLFHPDYQETPISKRHLNSDVNVLIRSVNELKATQIKLMQQ